MSEMGLGELSTHLKATHVCGGSFASGSSHSKLGQVRYTAESGSKCRAFATRSRALSVDGSARDVIQAPKLEPRIMRYELSDYEWAAIKPMLPNKPRGVRRVNDRRVLMASFGSCVQVRHGVTCQRPMVPAPPVTIASFGGGGLASGTRSWMRWLPATTRRCR